MHFHIRLTSANAATRRHRRRACPLYGRTCELLAAAPHGQARTLTRRAGRTAAEAIGAAQACCHESAWYPGNTGWRAELGAEGFGVGVVQVVKDGQGLGPGLAGDGQIAVGVVDVTDVGERLGLVPAVASSSSVSASATTGCACAPAVRPSVVPRGQSTGVPLNRAARCTCRRSLPRRECLPTYGPQTTADGAGVHARSHCGRAP